MIEIEKKFLASAEDIARVTDGAEFIKESINRDTYFDKKGFPGIKNNSFIRERNGKFEFKLYTAEKGSEVDKYTELEEESDIKKQLSIPEDKTIREYLEENEYIPFASFETTRKKFTKDGFTIDVDSVDFGYNVLEIELLIDNEDDAKESTEKILAFGKKFDLKTGALDGKVLEFIKRTDPDSYNEIKDYWDKKYG